MRIGLLTTSFPRHPDDIAGAFVLGFARALTRQGHSVEVLAPEPRRAQTAPSWPGVRVEHVPYLRPRALQRTFYEAGVPDNLARDPLAWLGLAPFSLQLARRVRSRARHWDAVFSHWALPCALAAGLVHPARRHVAIFHSADLHLLERLPMARSLARRIAQRADALWFVTAAQERRFVELLPPYAARPPSLVCPMGIDLPDVNSASQTERARLRSRHQLQGFSVLALARLVPIKGLDLAIRAVALTGRRCQLLIAGEGPERASLERLARELAADVRFLGPVVGAAKHELLRSVDAFMLSSRSMPDGRSEGLPTALLEALAHGLPVVAAENAGVNELFEDTPFARYLVPSEDPAALANALEDLRERTPAGLAEHARSIAARFSWSAVAKRATPLILDPSRPLEAPPNTPIQGQTL